jgi:hypothetical protein
VAGLLAVDDNNNLLEDYSMKQTTTPKMGWSMARAVIPKYLENNMNIFLTGMPGIGKTAIIEAIAKAHGYDLIKIHLAISEPTDMKGMPVWFEDKNGEKKAVFIPYAELEALVNAKKKTLAFFDDFGQAPGSCQAGGMQLFHGGTLNNIVIPKCVRFVVCSNRKQDRAGVQTILEPIKSRFHGIFELVPELDPFLQFGINEGWSPMLIAFMRNRPSWLTGGDDGWKPSNDIVNQANPRAIHHLADVMKLQLDSDAAPICYAGAVGLAMANELWAFEMLVTRLPDLDQVCNNPDSAEVPRAPDTMYAMMGALHGRMNAQNLGNIYKYIKRAFTKEMQMVFHLDVANFNAKLERHEAYIDWSVKNGHKLSN